MVHCVVVVVVAVMLFSAVKAGTVVTVSNDACHGRWHECNRCSGVSVKRETDDYLTRLITDGRCSFLPLFLHLSFSFVSFHFPAFFAVLQL